MNDNGDWLRQMADLQQQYWRGWQGAAGPAFFAPPQAPRAPWQDGIDAWKQMFAGPAATASAGGAGGDEVGARLLTYGRQYVDMLQQMANQAMAAGGSFDPRGWLSQMRTLHERFGNGMAAAGTPAMPWFGGIDPGQVEQLVRLFTSAPAQGMRNEMRGMFDMPAFGIGREQQERTQSLAQAWIDYQGANARYNELMLKTATRTLDVLEGKLAEREQPGRQIDSARALYDLWIDAAEDAFAEVAMSPDYRTIYGELVNSQMRVRAGINAEVERLAAQFGMPTRTEVDSMARQIHELRRALRQRRTASGSAGASGDTQRGERARHDTGADGAPARAATGARSRTAKQSPTRGKRRAGAGDTARRRDDSAKTDGASRGTKAAASTGAATGSRARSAATETPPGRSRAGSSAAGTRSRKAAPKRGDDAPMIQSTARKNAGAR